MPFSDTTNRYGIVELLSDITDTGSASATSYPLKTKTRDINLAYARYFMIAIAAEGRWQVDDTNQTDYPIITTNLVSNQQDYTFTVDGSSTPNQILDIYRVENTDPNGLMYLLKPIDMYDIAGIALSEFQKTAGIPQYYDKTANGLVLYPKSNYSATNGLKIYFNRTPSYFVSTDTTKKPGIPDIFHEYLAISPGYQYALRKSLANKNDLKDDMLRLEEDIRAYYSRRSQDEEPQMIAMRRSRLSH